MAESDVRSDQLRESHMRRESLITDHHAEAESVISAEVPGEIFPLEPGETVSLLQSLLHTKRNRVQENIKKKV